MPGSAHRHPTVVPTNHDTGNDTDNHTVEIDAETAAAAVWGLELLLDTEDLTDSERATLRLARDNMTGARRHS